MPDFPSSKIILHRFHIDKNEGKSGIGYDMIIYRDLMVKLGLSSDLNCKLLQWDGATTPMEEPRGMIGQKYITSIEVCEVVMKNE